MRAADVLARGRYDDLLLRAMEWLAPFLVVLLVLTVAFVAAGVWFYRDQIAARPRYRRTGWRA